LRDDRHLDRRLKLNFVTDSHARLFHPKALASRAHDGTTRVVVGSANITRGGAASNYEMAIVATEKTHRGDLYETVLNSVNALIRANLVVGFADKTSVDEVIAQVKSAEKHRRNTASERRKDALEQDRSETVDLHSLRDLLVNENQEITTHTPQAAEIACDQVQRFVSRGYFIKRSDPMTTFSVSVSLKKFRDAGILREQGAQELGTGLNLNQRGSSVNVSLLPQKVAQRIKEKRSNIGKLIMRFTIETFAGLWMPIDWMDAFTRHWSKCLGDEPLASYQGEIEEHLKGLDETLSLRDVDVDLYTKVFRIRAPLLWDERAFKLLDLRESKPKRGVLTESKFKRDAQAHAVNAIVKHIKKSVGSRNSLQYVASQVHMIEQPARLRAAWSFTPNDAADLLADLIIGGSAPIIRCTAKTRPKSGVAQFIHTQLCSRITPKQRVLDIFRQANRWKTELVVSSLERKDTTLAESWAKFEEWTGLRPGDIAWNRHIPTFNLKSERDDGESA